MHHRHALCYAKPRHGRRSQPSSGSDRCRWGAACVQCRNALITEHAQTATGDIAQPIDHQTQDVISGLQYNLSTERVFSLDKQRPLAALVEEAATILREGLPIKCLEAVFVALALTAGWTGMERVPLGFKSRVLADGQVRRTHICTGPCLSSGL